MSKNQSKQPNVVVFFTDQQRWDTTGAHGNPLGLTPNFDRMAARGTHLFHSFTNQPVCGPARSILQSGLYATTTGCYKNGIPLPLQTKTVAHHFRDAGYQTGYIGKWHLAPDPQQAVQSEWRGGYEYWLAANALEMCSDAYNTKLFDNDCREVKLPGYRVDALADAGIRFIDANQNNPFFLFMSFLEPHHQNHRDDYPAPNVYQEMYTGRWTPPDLAALGGTSPQHLGGYYGMVRRLDEALGRVLDCLASLNLENETIVLFTSDHGCHFKTRNQEYKRSCHESSIRVPTAIQGPGFWGGGQIRELVGLVDLPPTLLDAAGIPVPPEMQGHSMLPLTKGNCEGWPEEVFVQISESQVGRAVRTKRWKYGVTVPGLQGGKKSGSEEYTEQYLYDLQADPHELRNLIESSAHQHVKEVMRQRLIRRMVEAGEMKPTIIHAPQSKMGQLYVSSEEAWT